MKRPYHLWIGLIGLVVLHTAFFMRCEPVVTYFYSLVWWSYILTADGLAYKLKGHSLIMNQTREFLFLIPWSVTIWLIFEGFNLVLKNWYYVRVPKEISIRWPGYFIAYGTVLPGILVTKELLSGLGFFAGSHIGPVSAGASWYRPMIIIGTLCLIVPLLWPLYFFPLIWLGFVFLLEPFNHRFGRPSLLKDLEQGKMSNMYQFLMAGMICGILWEFWNFWAGAKWVYTVPWVGGVKLFEMPVLGFLGFPPFALECFVLVHFLGIFEPKPAGRKKPIWQVIPFWLFFYGVMFSAIDLYTVHSWLK